MAFPHQGAAMMPAPHPHLDAADAYGHASAQPYAMYPAASQTYHSADGTQAYTVDEYGRGTYWQLPPAPRLTSAAARGWHHQPQNHGALHAYAPWAAAHHHHHNRHYSQQPHYMQAAPQHHHDVEHQVMMQHRMSQLHANPARMPYDGHHGHQFNGSAPATYDPAHASAGAALSGEQYGGQGAHDWNTGHNDQRPPIGVRGPFFAEVPHGSYDPRNPQSLAHAQQPGREELQDWYHQGQPHVRTHHTTWPAQGASSSRYGAWDQGQAQHLDHYYPRHPFVSKLPSPFDSHRAPRTGSQHPPAPLIRQIDPATGHAINSQHDLSFRQLDPATGHPVHWQTAAANPADGGIRPSDGQYAVSGHDAAVQAQPGEASHANPAPEAAVEKPPGPPSPDTLDKSSVPMSAFGAEIIWHACTVLSEPDLLSEAYADVRTPASSGSSASSPLISTPKTSPQSPDAHGKHLDDPSSLMSSMELEPDLDGRHNHGLSAVSEGFTRELTAAGASRGFPSAELSHSAASKRPAVSSPGQGSPAVLSSRRLPTREGLQRTKSRERSRAAVLSVLSLVSPQMCWSVAEAKLPSLLEASMRHSDDAARRADAQRQASPRECANGFTSNSEVNPAFRRFAHQVLAQTLLSPTAFLLALLYALRVPLLAVDDFGNADHEAIEVFASPPSAAPFKLFTLGLMIANKHLDDNTFLNKTWNEVTGIPLPELNRMEAYYLMRSNYEIALPDKAWTSFLCAVRHREEAKAAAAHLVGLHESVHGTSHASDQTGRRGSTASEEASRRVLLALDEISCANGGIEPIALPPRDPWRRAGSDTPVECSMRKSSHDDSDATIRVNDGGLRSASQQRPTSALHHSHQHHQSAPVSAAHFREDLAGHSTGHYDLWQQRPPFEALARSLSEHAKDTIGFGRSTSSSSAATAQAAGHDAPLAPSALLELLNSGRGLTEAM